MRWLKEQGLSDEQIRDMRWGMVDETERCIHFPTSVTSYKMDLNTGKIECDVSEKTIDIPIKNSGHEWFFLKSKYKCPWMFTREKPKTWRKEGSREACYLQRDVKRFTKTAYSPVSHLLWKKIEALTKMLVSDKIEVSIANITKTETKEQTEVETRI